MSFTVLRPLGRGGAAEVVLAREDATQRLVALKRPLTVDHDHAEALEREAALLATLQHPSIIGFVGTGVDVHGRWLALEYVEGATVAEVQAFAARAGRPLSAEAVLVLGQRIAEALCFAHERSGGPVVHRDVSAANVLVNTSGALKLADFGIARGPQHDVTSWVRGTVSALAPELLDGATPTPASDVFSLGTLLYRAATGVEPFPGKTQAAVIDALRNSRPPSVSRFTPLPPAVCEWIDAALSSQPQSRPPLRALMTAIPAASLDVGRAQWGLLVVELSAADPPSRWTMSLGATRTPTRRWLLPALAAAGIVALGLVLHTINPLSWAPPVGKLRLKRLHPLAVLRIDGQIVADSVDELSLGPGPHVVTQSENDGQRCSMTVELTAGETTVVTLSGC